MFIDVNMLEEKTVKILKIYYYLLSSFFFFKGFKSQNRLFSNIFNININILHRNNFQVINYF